MKKCYKCNGELILTKDLVIKNGRSFPIEVEMCTSCGESFSTLEEAARVRKELYPSFVNKIKRFLCGSESIELSFLRGRIL